jgi:hypothetical protein
LNLFFFKIFDIQYVPFGHNNTDLSIRIKKYYLSKILADLPIGQNSFKTHGFKLYIDLSLLYSIK